MARRNPALGIKRLKHHGKGSVRWPESEITAYRNFYSLGTRERLVFELAIGTAHRRGDLVRLGWRHIVNGAISVKQNKTGESNDSHCSEFVMRSISARVTA